MGKPPHSGLPKPSFVKNGCFLLLLVCWFFDVWVFELSASQADILGIYKSLCSNVKHVVSF